MRAVALVCILAFSAHAQTAPQDAPVVQELTPDEKLAVARYIVSLETENAELKKGVQNQMHPAVFVAILVLATVAGGAVGFGIAKAAK